MRFLLSLLMAAGAVMAFSPRSATAARPLVWYNCYLHLDARTASHVVKRDCYAVPLRKRHRAPRGWTVTRRRLSPHVIHGVRFPAFPPPPSSLPGCPPAIARWAGLIVPAARAYGVPVPVMTGVMQIESRGDPEAYNPASGAAGLYQFLPSTAAALGINPYDPAQATDAAALYIADHGLLSFSGGGYGSAWYCD